MVVTDRFPCDRAARAEDEKTRERAEFKEFEGSAFFDCTSELTTPVGVTEGRELVEFLQGRNRCFCVGLFIMMMGGVVECLDCRQRLRVKGYSVFICAC